MAWQAVIGHGLAHEAMGGGFGVLSRAVSYATNSVAPIEIPSVGELMDLAIRGWIDEEALRDGALAHGVTLDTSRTTTVVGGRPGSDTNVVWKQAYYARQELPTLKETHEIANRYLKGDGWVIDSMKRLGYYSDVVRQQLTNLRYDIPGPSDLVRFSVRHVWEPDLLKQIGYDQEFPGAIIDVWHAMKGLDYPLFSGPFSDQIDFMTGGAGGAARLKALYAANGISEPTWAKAYWWSHWVLPSPGQFFDMLIRLDPDRDRSFDPPEAVGLDFTLDDYQLGLRANDYPPKYRKMLAAINRPIVGVRFLRDFVKQGVYQYNDIVEWARRWGFSPRDQKDIADDVWRNVKGQQQKPAACKGCAVCDQAFEVGIILESELEQCYADYGADPQEAARLAQLASAKLKIKRGREIVSNIRKRFLKGVLSAQEAEQLLTGWGITLERTGWYIQDWQLEFEAGRKELSAQQAIKYTCQGLIAVDELVRRLTNLGYPDADQQALLAEAALCAANLASQAQSKQARKDRQAKADAYTACRRARQLVTETQRYLASHGSPKDLQKWFCEGSIGECEVYSRLNALGWPDTDITRYLSDCKGGKKPTGRCSPGTPLVPPECPQ